MDTLFDVMGYLVWVGVLLLPLVLLVPYVIFGAARLTSRSSSDEFLLSDGLHDTENKKINAPDDLRRAA